MFQGLYFEAAERGIAPAALAASAIHHVRWARVNPTARHVDTDDDMRAAALEREAALADGRDYDWEPAGPELLGRN